MVSSLNPKPLFGLKTRFEEARWPLIPVLWDSSIVVSRHTFFFSEFWINSYSCYPIILLRSTSLRRKKNMILSGITTRMLLLIVMHIPVQLKLLLCRRLVKIFMPPTNLTLLKRFVILHVSFVFLLLGCCHRRPLLVPGGRAFVWPSVQQVQR